MLGPVISLECEGFREGSTSWQASHGNQVLPSQVTFFPKEEVEEQSSSPKELFGKGGRHLAVFSCDGKGPRAG